MVHKNKWQEMLYRATYDKPGLNRRAFAFKKSLDEVKKTLQEKGTPRKIIKHRSEQYLSLTDDAPYTAPPDIRGWRPPARQGTFPEHRKTCRRE